MSGSPIGMLRDLAFPLVPLLGGLVLARVFCATLRLTIERGLVRPMVFLLGFFFRLGIVMFAMSLLCGPSAAAWLWCLAGFTVGKAWLVRSQFVEVDRARV